MLSKPLESEAERLSAGPAGWQRQWFDVIFGHESPAGKAFDVVLLVVILISVAAVMLETVASLQVRWGRSTFVIAEWIITILFSLEFLARIACLKRPMRYILSFYGVVDMISILPSYVAFFFTGAHTLATVRMLRLLRVFRVLKLARHVREAQLLLLALRQTWPKITVFISVLVCSIVIFGTLMYLVEADADSGFDDIPTSVYWAIVTMTTVGYGDIAPATSLGKFIAAMIMLFGYAIIIVPTGIFSAQVISAKTQSRSSEPPSPERQCNNCGSVGHVPDASFCKNCGAEL